jgi:hypothetical protein
MLKRGRPHAAASVPRHVRLGRPPAGGGGQVEGGVSPGGAWEAGGTSSSWTASPEPNPCTPRAPHDAHTPLSPLRQRLGELGRGRGRGGGPGGEKREGRKGLVGCKPRGDGRGPPARTNSRLQATLAPPPPAHQCSTRPGGVPARPSSATKHATASGAPPPAAAAAAPSAAAADVAAAAPFAPAALVPEAPATAAAGALTAASAATRGEVKPSTLNSTIWGGGRGEGSTRTGWFGPRRTAS